MGTKVLDTATEGDGTVFNPVGNFKVHVTGSLNNGNGASAGKVQLLCSQDGGTTYDVVEEFSQSNERHRFMRTWGTADGVDYLVDYAADATMGPDAAASDTLLYSDGTHATTLGQQNLANIDAPVLNAI